MNRTIPASVKIVNASIIVASPDAPQTTSAPVPVRGIDQQVLGETRLRLGISQPVSSSRRPARQQPLDRTRNRLLRSPGAHLGRRRTTPRVTIARRHSPDLQP